MSTRRRFYLQMSLTNDAEMTLMEQEFERLIQRVKRDEESKLKLIIDNTRARPGESLMDEE